MKSLMVSLFILLTVVFSSDRPVFHKEDCKCGDIFLAGRVEIVDHNPDFRVRIVDFNEDLIVKVREYGAFFQQCGEWRFVDNNPDFKIEFVDHDPDFKIRFRSY